MPDSSHPISVTRVPSPEFRHPSPVSGGRCRFAHFVRSSGVIFGERLYFQRSQKSLLTLSPNPICVINRRNGCSTTLLKKGLTENPKNRLSLITLSPNPICVINRRNGFGSTVSGQRLRLYDCFWMT